MLQFHYAMEEIAVLQDLMKCSALKKGYQALLSTNSKQWNLADVYLYLREPIQPTEVNHQNISTPYLERVMVK
jgi:gluconate kinase